MTDTDKAGPFDAEGRYRNPQFREFVSTVSSADADRHAGLGLTVEAVIEDWQDTYRGGLALEAELVASKGGSFDPVENAREYNDLVIWAGRKVVAVLRPDPAGAPELLVDRYDLEPDDATEPGPEPAPDEVIAERRREGEELSEDMGVEELERLEEENRRRYGPAWSICEGEFQLYHSHRRMTLDEVIREETHGRDGEPLGFPPDAWDRAIWLGERLMAVVRPGPDGRPIVIRLDGGPLGPAPVIEVDRVAVGV